MIKLHLLLLFSFLVISCNSQTSNNFTVEKDNSVLTTRQKEELSGIIYFSFDDGNNWVNKSLGLPENATIGLGGIAVSDQNIGVATKENGIYLFNFRTNLWVNVPTEKQIIEGNIGALAIIDNVFYVGTQFKGVFSSKDSGQTWKTNNSGLNNLTIRRFCELKNRFYVCTNDGFYALNEDSGNWQPEFGQSSLQVNGVALFDECFYLATNKGIYKQQKGNTWLNISPHLSVHNISSDKYQIYAMTYNELLLASKDGTTWESQQNGLPENLYTFNVLNHNNIVFAGQWDGIYRKNINSNKWELSSNGLPSNFAVTNLKAFNSILVISTAERKRKKG